MSVAGRHQAIARTAEKAGVKTPEAHLVCLAVAGVRAEHSLLLSKGADAREK
jgi:hypothetical protein